VSEREEEKLFFAVKSHQKEKRKEEEENCHKSPRSGNNSINISVISFSCL
jgi:hypothetical protein